MDKVKILDATIKLSKISAMYKETRTVSKRTTDYWFRQNKYENIEVITYHIVIDGVILGIDHESDYNYLKKLYDDDIVSAIT